MIIESITPQLAQCLASLAFCADASFSRINDVIFGLMPGSSLRASDSLLVEFTTRISSMIATIPTRQRMIAETETMIIDELVLNEPSCTVFPPVLVYRLDLLIDVNCVTHLRSTMISRCVTRREYLTAIPATLSSNQQGTRFLRLDF